MTTANKELTGRHVLFMVLAFFGIIISVNTYFIVMAVKSFSGEDVPRSYRQGLEYNQTIEAREHQSQLGWTVTANRLDERILVSLTDIDGQPLTNLSLTAKLRHPTVLSNDQILIFKEVEPGLYAASTRGFQGKWLLIVDAKKSEDSFRFEYALWLS